MPRFQFRTDVPSFFQQLRRYVFLITEEYKDSPLYEILVSEFQEYPKNIQQNNSYIVFARNIIKIMPLSNQLTMIDVYQLENSHHEIYESLIQKITEHPLIQRTGEYFRRPAYKTEKRFYAFKKIKEEHPEWTQAKVALEATDVLGEICTQDTVRNTYRLMGEEWKRGDRTR